LGLSVTNNAQFSYEMEWTFKDRLNPTKAYTEYKQIWDELNRQFGGDPDYTRHVIRSPMYIQGWHRKNPLQRGSSTHINTNTTPLWHHVKWYPPRAYSLAELRELIVFLQKLHGENTELEQLPSNVNQKCCQMNQKSVLQKFPTPIKMTMIAAPTVGCLIRRAFVAIPSPKSIETIVMDF
jgi:hypothetical protein